MSQTEQLTIAGGIPAAPAVETFDESAARRTLRAQVARLERELSEIVAAGFPHIPVGAARLPREEAFGGPRLLSLEQLERPRDRLAARVQDLRGMAPWTRASTSGAPTSCSSG